MTSQLASDLTCGDAPRVPLATRFFDDVSQETENMSGQWTNGNGKNFWIKTGKDHVEVHEDGKGLVKRLDGLSSSQVTKFGKDPRTILTPR